jgi:hypothetical protein
MKPFPAKFYRAPSGREPVREWLKGLPREECQIIGEDLMRVEFRWPNVGLPHGSFSWAESVGSPQQLIKRYYRSRDFLSLRKPDALASWFYQENTKDACKGN